MQEIAQGYVLVPRHSYFPTHVRGLRVQNLQLVRWDHLFNWRVVLTDRSQNFNEIMPCIYARFMEKEAKQWRQIYKVRLRAF